MNQVKDTILKANHNQPIYVRSNKKLYESSQRYNFESKSQLIHQRVDQKARCMNQVKDTILKANHNALFAFLQSEFAV